MIAALVDDEPVLRAACTRAGFTFDKASLIHRHATAIYLLEPVGLIARLQRGPHARQRADRAVAITRWLTSHAVPVTVPADVQQPVHLQACDIEPVPQDPDTRHGQASVTFWHHYPQPAEAAPSAAALGEILRHLHSLPTPRDIELDRYIPLERFGTVLARTQVLDESDRVWLDRRRAELLAAYGRLRSRLGEGLIHGDAYPGNLLWAHKRAILGDWDEVAFGPRELDLIFTHHGERFGRSHAEREAFSATYGYDVTTWDGFETLRAIRDLHTLTAYIERSERNDSVAHAELLHRIATLRNNNHQAKWNII